MNTQQQQEQEPRLCARGCGFFANPNCGDMCSKCNREQQANQATAKAIASSAAPAVQQPSESVVSLPIPAASTAAPSQSAAALQNPMLPATPPAAEAADAALPASSQPPLSPKVLEAVSAAAEAALAEGSSQQHTAAAASAAAAEDGADEGPPRRVQKNTNRCFSCNKKIGLTGFKCRCGFVFCGPHRLAEAHDCDFDYKGAGRESLAKANPLVQAERIARF